MPPHRFPAATARMYRPTPPVLVHIEDSEPHSVLRPIVAEWLAGERNLTPTETVALRDYMARWIRWKAETIERLGQEIAALGTREEYAQWFAAARFHDLDPVE